MAQIFLLRGDIENGKKYAIKSVNGNEKNIWYLMLLASIYYDQKSLDSTIIYYEKALKYFPEKESIRLKLANLYSEKEKYGKAKEIYNYFEEKYGINENTTLLLVRNLIALSDYENAERKIKSLIELSPDAIIYYDVLAEIYSKKGEKEKALNVYKMLMEKDAKKPETILSLCNFLLTEKKYDEFIELLSSIIIKNDITKDNKIALFLKIVGDTNLIIKRGKEIEVNLLILEANYNNDQVIPLIRPELYINQNRISDAIVRLEELILKQPENYYIWEKLLLLYNQTKDFNNLYVKGKECATKFNRSFLAKVLFASAALEKGELNVCQEELRKAKILAGDQKEMQIQVLSMEADLYYRKEDYKKSFEVFKEALKIDPGDLMILNNYAYFLAEQNTDLKSAEKMAKSVIGKEKNNKSYLDTYAWILYKRNKIKEAEKTMELVFSIGENNDAELYEHYGYILKKRGNCVKAIEYWKSAVKLDKKKSNLINEIKNCQR
jgi:predicted Zn-dependent protease